MFLLFSSAALAGKLSEGWRGIPYGSAEPLAEAPAAGCARNPEPGAAWSCPLQVGTVPVLVAYMVEEGLFSGVVFQARTYPSCADLMETLRSGWGPGRKAKDYQTDALPDWSWADGDVIASFEFNRFSATCTVITIDVPVYQQAKARRASEAAKGAEDL